jgi:hypothetical protein
MADKKAPPADLGRRLEALVAHAPDRTTWKAITAELDRVPASRLAAIVKKAGAALRGWPLGLRSMPQRWWDALTTGKDEPRAALARRRTLWASSDDDEHLLSTYALQVDVSPDLSTFVTADAAEWHHDGGDIVLWDSRTGVPRKVLLSGRDYQGEPFSLLYSPDGRWIAAAPVEARARGSLRLWDAASGELVWTQDLAPKKRGAGGPDDDEGAADDERATEMIALDFTPDNKRIWSASRRLGRLRSWDVATGATRSELPDEAGVTAIRVSPKGHLLATGSETGWLRVWDLRDESLLAERKVGEKPIWSVVFSADGKRVASAGRTLDLWTLDLEELVKTESHPLAARGDAIAGAFSLVALRGGVIRAAAIVHGGAIVRDLPGRKIHKIKLETGLESIRLSRDGRRLAAGNTRRVRLFWLEG